MARTTSPPLVDHTHLLHLEDAAEPIAVGSAAWYAWLDGASSFAFRSQHGTFTAHKERRSPTQEYWKAYRRRAGRLDRVYLGKSGELTTDRLDAAAAELGNQRSADNPPAGTTTRETALGTSTQEARPPLPEHSPPAFTARDDAQSLHLLATKLTIPPLRAMLVPRPRLAAQIDMAIAQQQKLILIAAPAGFGKTTLIAEWLASRSSELGKAQIAQSSKRIAQHSQAAWLALDDNDNHLGQFLAYLIAALETARPMIGAEAWPLLRAQAAHPPTHAILTRVVNALADPAEQIVLVLDDYHTITLQAIHEATTFLLDRMPAHMQIVITTRADPPLPLARLRARGQLTELRAADLRFASDEAAYLFGHIHNIAFAPDALAALEARTEGWATGLQFAALSLRQRDVADMPAFLADFTGSHTYVFDYLADEVFQRQPDHVRSFLMLTAILGRMCGPLCAAVTGRNDAQTLLEELAQANTFVVHLDDNRRWYRYHHLFHDFLREHLDRTTDTAEQAKLHQHASAWFEQQGFVGEAIEHALSAQDWGAALRCMNPLMESQRFYEYYLDWPRWLAALPDATLAAEPDRCRRLAWILIFTGHLEDADRPLSLAEAAWRWAGDQAKIGELLGLRAMALWWKGDFPHAIQAAQQALALLPTAALDRQGLPAFVLGASDLRLGHIGAATDWLSAASAVTQRKTAGAQHPSELFLSLATSATLAYAYQLRGDLRHAAGLYRDVIKRMSSVSYLQVPSALIYLGSLQYEWNDLAEAEQMLRAGIAASERIGRARYWPSAWVLLAQVLLAAGDLIEAWAMAKQALVLAHALDNPSDIIEADALQGRLWLAEGDLDAARHWLNTRAAPPEGPLLYTHQTEYLMHARIYIARAQQAPGSIDLSAVVHQLNQLLYLAETDQRMGDRITIRALLALAHAVAGDPTQVSQNLAAAIQLAAPEGYIRAFVNEGAPMRALLLELRGQLRAIAPADRMPAYIDRLLEAFELRHPAQSTTPAATNPLSEREQAVFLLLAEGRSIPEIAATLVISTHTARTHVKNIYTKLDAHNRVQALDRARTLQLLR